METVPSNVPLTFEVTYDAGDLNVGMSVYDTTPTNAVLVYGPVAMTAVENGTFCAKFTPGTNRSYLVFKGVYTDDSLETLDPNYPQGSESIFAIVFNGGGGGGSNDNCGSVVGYVDNSNEVVGFVENNNVIIGLVTC